MAEWIADKRDVAFVIHEQFEAGRLSDHKIFEDFSKKTVDLVLKEVRNLAIKEVLPTNHEGDKQGCQLDNGKVSIPDSFPRIWEMYRSGEWLAMSESSEWGGQGMPQILASAATEYLNGANMALFMYVALTHGAAHLIETFGTPEQKSTYVKKMYTGQWSGTMLLTEAGAGSDVGALETRAIPQPDGTYKIEGNKIFISGGEHDMVENIIHPVLARIEGAPKGTKGISLFIVPKYRVNHDGSLGAFNDVVCTGIEHKMGIHGNCTCSLALGSKGECVGYLLGEANKGMKVMFQMMNEARLYVGVQGLSLASSAYLNAVNYARERIQGPNMLKAFEGDLSGVPIIQHPDIRRQLMTMKAYVEGMRSLIYYVGFCFDQIKIQKDEARKDELNGIIDILIPVAKGYVSDKAFEVCSTGMQVYGGYGFVEEYPQAQLMRDCRITMIYEGTNGIQAMDLLGRKLGMKKGKPMMDLLAEIQIVIARAKAVDSLVPLANDLEVVLAKLGEAMMHMGKIAMSPDVMNAFAFAHPLLEAMGDVVMGWMLLWRAVVAEKAIIADKKDAVFYKGQINSARFFIETVLPVTHGKIRAILKTSNAAMSMDEAAFTS
ncbi:acyl-CoA dehydrogenase [Desulforegula conservatrix]|uniref:acyl-CoA dehydrogenase n=1 Tax=Desulforegula conservatrix TaxID=153026 RepID=UPI00041F0F6C|nr:acyl-CoA dehydrogenase [Desulforegula conservatrix]